jgi:hypothetical protein
MEPRDLKDGCWGGWNPYVDLNDGCWGGQSRLDSAMLANFTEGENAAAAEAGKAAGQAPWRGHAVERRNKSRVKVVNVFYRLLHSIYAKQRFFFLFSHKRFFLPILRNGAFFLFSNAISIGILL